MKKLIFSVISFMYRLLGLHIGKNVEILAGRAIEKKYITIGDSVAIGARWVIACYPNYAGKDNPLVNNIGVVIEKGTKIGRDFTVYCGESVHIGENCLFGSNILVTDNNHGMDPTRISFYDQPIETKPTSIGDGCWVGENVCILAGTKIGNHCIIGAGSIVSGEFPDYSLILGVPAKIKKIWNKNTATWEKV